MIVANINGSDIVKSAVRTGTYMHPTLYTDGISGC